MKFKISLFWPAPVKRTWLFQNMGLFKGRISLLLVNGLHSPQEKLEKRLSLRGGGRLWVSCGNVARPRLFFASPRTCTRSWRYICGFELRENRMKDALTLHQTGVKIWCKQVRMPVIIYFFREQYFAIHLRFLHVLHFLRAYSCVLRWSIHL